MPAASKTRLAPSAPKVAGRDFEPAPDSFRRLLVVERDPKGVQLKATVPHPLGEKYPDEWPPMILRPEFPGVGGTRTIFEYRTERRIFDSLAEALSYAYHCGLWSGHVPA